MWPVGYLFLCFWGFGGQVGSGSETFQKMVSKNQTRFINFSKNCVFFDSWFLTIFFKFLWTAVFRFWSPKWLKWCPLWEHSSNLFVEKVEMWNLCFRGDDLNSSWFLGAGFGDIGPFFVRLFFKVARGFAFYDFCSNLVPTRITEIIFWLHFPL